MGEVNCGGLALLCQKRGLFTWKNTLKGLPGKKETRAGRNAGGDSGRKGDVLESGDLLEGCEQKARGERK